jgi:hypothetical protein
MSTFLRLELASRDGDVTLINVEHIVRIAPTWPKGSTLVLSDDTSLHVRASLDELQARLCSTGGRAHVYTVQVDAARLEQRADDLVAEAGYRDMLAHPESIVDAQDLF